MNHDTTSPAASPGATTPCHSCGTHDLEVAPGYAAFHRVTSDCKPWPPGGVLARCRSCGLVQTLTTPAWHAEADAIYRGYTIYHQSGGSEQRVFDGRGGPGQPRSEQIIRALLNTRSLPDRGRLLDLGCGNGSFLSAWSRLVPGWALAGSEVSEKYLAEVEAIPGFERLYTGDFAEIPGEFDAISMIHVLEHIPGPVAFLRRLRTKLRPGGLLIVEVPDCGQNRFMLLVADHCSHFSPALLGAVVAAAGFEDVHATDAWVAKEVSVVASRGDDGDAPAPRGLPAAESERVFGGWRSLKEILARVEPLAKRPAFALFGTAIAATWLDAQTGNAAKFFVDEDPNRRGKTHLGRPILAPDDVPPGATIFVALPEVLAGKVAGRLNALGRGFEIVVP